MSIKVLIVDDSVFMRQILKDILKTDDSLDVIGIAKDGKEAVELIPKLKPDVVTLDVEMPNMNGIEVLRWIMKNYPLPVVMVSALTHKGSQATIEALELGAVDFVGKPSGSVSMDLGDKSPEILTKVKTAAGANLTTLKMTRKPMAPTPAPAPLNIKRRGQKIVAIGTSTGGPKALSEVIPMLPANLAAGVVIVQHMPAGFTNSLAQRLNQASALEVYEAKAGDKVTQGKVLIAPGGFHLSVEKGGAIHLNEDPPIHGLRPTVDIMMESVARNFKQNVIGVVLTGMGTDGAEGMKLIKEHNGQTIAEHESTCTIYGMPKAVVEGGLADLVVPLPKVAGKIVELLWS